MTIPPRPFILLIDDEVDLIEVLRDAVGLTMPEYDALAYTSVEEAEAGLSTIAEAPSLVCVDHKLGEQTGLEFLEALRRRYPDLPAILFTGQAPAGVQAKAEAMGARVLWKPIALTRWIGEVRQLLA